MTYFLFFLALLSPQWESFRDKVLSNQDRIPGWCSKEKARYLMDFVHQVEPQLIVEIGSFAGSTTHPLAQALSYSKKGHLYAIDAWDNTLASEGFDPSSSHFSWWRTLDFASIKKSFLQLIREQNLSKIVSIFSMNSRDVISQLPDLSIDLLYLDGNFSAEGSFLDLQLYYPKVKSGGYIILNNSDSPSKKKSLNFLMNECHWLKTQSLGKECCCFQKK